MVKKQKLYIYFVSNDIFIFFYNDKIKIMLANGADK